MRHHRTFLSSHTSLLRKNASRLKYLLCAFALVCGGDLWSQVDAASRQQNTRFSISGHIFFPNNNPAIQVIVKLSGLQNGVNLETITDDQGRYEFRGLGAGTYSVSAKNPAVTSQVSDTIETDTSRTFSGNLTVNLFLRPPAENKAEQKKGILSVAEATQNVPKKARALYAQSLKLKESQQHKEALEKLNQALEIYPDYYQALTTRGEIHIAARELKQAASDFAQALKINESYEAALRDAGYCALETGDHTQAAEYLEKAIKEDPTNAVSYLLLGIARLGEGGHQEEAEAALKQAIKLNPLGAARAHIHLANLYSGEHRYAEAVDELQIYLTMTPGAPDAAQIKAAQDSMRARIAQKK